MESTLMQAVALHQSNSSSPAKSGTTAHYLLLKSKFHSLHMTTGLQRSRIRRWVRAK